jgi:cytosine/adenosine deaminase-related metal-dependent hydrolase
LDFEKTILGHCLYLEDNERKIISESKSWIVQNMESNQNNRVGYFNSKGLGNRIMLGTDGMHSDMLQSARSVFLSGAGNEYNSPSDTYNRFRNVHNYIADNKLSGDADNNLVILNYDSPTEITASNFVSHFVYGFNSNHVETLISNGNLIMKNKEVLNVDEAEILKFTRKEGKKLWEKMQK